MTKQLEDLYATHTGKVSDKWSVYLAEYERLFDDIRLGEIRFLEIGVQNGGSLEIWAKYFRNAEIVVGCDVNSDCMKLDFDSPSITVVVGDANSDQAQADVLARSARFDVIVDDGSHCSGDIVKAFARYFPALNAVGMYVVEDLHCSYWQEFEGGLFDPHSSIAFFKLLVDIVNHESWGIDRSPSTILAGFFKRYDFSITDDELKCIHSVEFVNSMCVISKREPERNKLGSRFIAGSVEDVVGGHLGLHSSSNVVPNQSGNDWTSRSLPPDEELLLRLGELSERDAQLAAIRQSLSERDAQLAAIRQSLSERDAQLAAVTQSLSERDAQLAGLSHALAEREGEVARIVNSISWRITRPLRMLRRLGSNTASRLGLETPAVQHISVENGSGQPLEEPTPISTKTNSTWRPPLTRFEMICGRLNLKGRGVEVGPSYSPILPKAKGYPTLVVDHMSADELRAKYKAWNVDTTAIEEVDIIWSIGPFAEALRNHGRFDYVVASHVIEHIPDPIRFFQECEKILNPDGKISLVVPDKRYCFDFYRPLTTTGEWFEAYLQEHTVHPPRKHFDNFAYAVVKGTAIAWGQGADGDIILQDHTLEMAKHSAEKQHGSNEYQDVHGWQFTPESFCMVLRELEHLGLINWSIAASHPTHGFEFFITLERSTKGLDTALTNSDRLALVSASLSPYAEAT